MKKYKIFTRLILPILIITLIVLFIIFTKSSKKTAKKTSDEILKLNPQVAIEMMTKFSVQPHTLKKGDNFVFLIAIESFQNKNLLKLDLMKTAFLEDDLGQIEKPISWEILKKSEFAIYGKLIFAEKFINQKKIFLTLLNIEVEPFSWDLSSTSTINL